MWTAPGQRPRIYSTHPLPADGPALLRSVAEVRTFAGTGSPSRADIIRDADDADVLCFFVPDRIDDALLARLPRVRMLAGFGKGYDNVDIAAATMRGIRVTNVPDALTGSTADLAWALLLGLARGVRSGDSLVRSGRFTGWSAGAQLGTAIAGKTLGIVGYGAIGRAIAERAHGFAMRMCYSDVGGGVPLEQLLGEADVVVLTLPLSDETRHLIDADRLRRFKPAAFLINVARGSIVDEAAVADALDRGALAGYAADVFELEDRQYADRPMTIDARIVASPHTLLTPHIGTATHEDRRRLAVVQAESILAFLDGRVPSTSVNDVPIAALLR